MFPVQLYAIFITIVSIFISAALSSAMSCDKRTNNNYCYLRLFIHKKTIVYIEHSISDSYKQFSFPTKIFAFRFENILYARSNSNSRYNINAKHCPSFPFYSRHWVPLWLPIMQISSKFLMTFAKQLYATMQLQQLLNTFPYSQQRKARHDKI